MPGVSSTTVGFPPFRGARSPPKSPAAGWDNRRRDARAAFKDPGESALHQVAVLQHIGDPGGHAQIVFEDVDLAVAIAHQIGSGDVAPDSQGGLMPWHCGR